MIIGAMAFSLVGCGSKESVEKDQGKANEIEESTAGSEEVKAVSMKLSSKEAEEVIDNETDVIILDVRTQDEYNSGHIKDSILIPVDDLEKNAEAKLEDKNKKILIYCRSGNRSNTAAKILASMGYTQVYDFGGINSWQGEIVK